MESLYNPDFSAKEALRKVIFFYSESDNWFIRYYFLLMLSSYVLNPVLNSFNKGQLGTLVLIVLFINVYLGFCKHWTINDNGYTLSHMIMVYIIGRAVRTYGLVDYFSKSKFITVYFLLSIVLGCIISYCFSHHVSGTATYRLLGYNNPIILLSAISLFCFFAKFNYKNAKINYILSGTLGIFLIHVYSPLKYMILYPAIRAFYDQYNIGYFLLFAFLLVAVVVVMGICVNLLINKAIGHILSRQGIKATCDWLDKKLCLSSF